MSKPRLLYQHWIIDRIPDPRLEELQGFISGGGSDDNSKIIRAVQDAMEKLTEEEREFIIHYYFRGLNLTDVAREINRKPTRMGGLHRQAVRKLKKQLAGFVEMEFGIKPGIVKPCPVCESPHKLEIEEIIGARTSAVPWSSVLAELKRKLGIVIRAPQVLISHKKYHV